MAFSAELSLKFLTESAPSPGLFYAAAAFDLGTHPEVVVYLLGQLVPMGESNLFVTSLFIEKVASFPCIAEFVGPLIQIGLDLFRLSPAFPGRFLQLLSLHHSDQMLHYRDHLQPLTALEQIEQNDQIPYILMFWNLNSAGDSPNEAQLLQLGSVILRNCESAVAEAEAAPVCSFLDYLRVLVQNSGRLESSECMMAYVRGLLAKLLEVLFPIFLIDHEEVQESLNNMLEHSFLHHWITDPTLILSWIDTYASLYPLLGSHLRLLSVIPVTPSESVTAFLVRHIDSDNADFVRELFHYFRTLIHSATDFFLEHVTCEYVLAFFNSPIPEVHSIVIEFVQSALSLGNPGGLVENAVRALLQRFAVFEKGTQNTALRFLAQVMKADVPPEALEAMLEELYPAPSHFTDAISHALRSSPLLAQKFAQSLLGHIKCNLEA
jgi:hypothetical protein